jgi:hypothetical protein
MNESSSELGTPMRHGFVDAHLIPVILTITMLPEPHKSQTLELQLKKKKVKLSL